MAPSDRLRGLQMGETGHDPIGPGLCLVQQRLDQRQQSAFGGVELVAGPQLEICRHLIVARPARVQTPCRFADDFFQARLDVHVNVFQRGRIREGAALDL